MDKRYLGAVILSPLIIVLFIGGIYLKVLVAIVSLLGIYEFFNIMRMKNYKPLTSIAIALTLFYYILIIFNKSSLNVTFLILAFSLFIMLSVPVLNDKYNFIDVAITLLGFFYVSVFFSFIVLVSEKDFGKYIVWTIFISAWMCDTVAYYSGKFFGKNKLCPKVSPKKTIEGSIGGLIGSTLGCMGFGIFINNIGVNIPLFNFILIGFISGIFSQMGDLVASSIKRFIGVKDYSNLIPGHGGILDRFDSILFSSVVVYYYVTIIMGM